MTSRTATFRFGIDELLRRPPLWLRRGRVGLVCHPASVDSELNHTADRLHRLLDSRLVCLFGPQHGARGEKQDNMIESADFTDRDTALPVHSLYGAFREPTHRMLADVDVLLVDLQDVGARVYTFASTLLACMRAAARRGIRIAVLDRPNPIGGLAVEGHVLEPDLGSFVGVCPGVPMRHGLTLGELGRLFNAQLQIECELCVIAMHGWRRAMHWHELDRQWVSPSPNMPSALTALVYPGAVLFEGTNVSEGRGTTRPFELIGAPWIDPRRLVKSLQRHRLAGVCFRAVYFEPTFHKFAGQLCGGVQIHVVDAERFDAYRTGLAVLSEIRRNWPTQFAWRPPPYEYDVERPPIDLIAGTSRVRTAVERLRPAMDASDRARLASFRRHARQFWLYD